MKKKAHNWRNSLRISGPVCDHSCFDDWEVEESRLRKELFTKETEEARRLPTHRVNDIANSHDYNCRCGFCIEFLSRNNK